jgi:hypothetical protein
MGTTKKNTTEINAAVSVEQETKEKKCFAIMPIAEHPDYESGHFSRVYNHLIKPACEKAGFKVVRADDAKASHMIMFDILKNIVECDMAICDLSSKNANVFYELGLRQAFNKKTILITDGRTNTPFDISGFRYVKYDHSLRIDSVLNDIDEISAMLSETEEASEDDVNSIIKLLKIQPANIEGVQLNEQDSLIFTMIKQLDEKMTRIERFQKKDRNIGHALKGSPTLSESIAKFGKSGINWGDEKTTNKTIYSFDENGDLIESVINTYKE